MSRKIFVHPKTLAPACQKPIVPGRTWELQVKLQVWNSWYVIYCHPKTIINIEKESLLHVIAFISIKMRTFIQLNTWCRLANKPLLQPWWRHQLEKFSTSLDLCEGNPPVTGKFLPQRPVTRSFEVFFDLRSNKRLSKQSKRWWFETRRTHYDVTVMLMTNQLTGRRIHAL